MTFVSLVPLVISEEVGFHFSRLVGLVGVQRVT